MRCAGTWARYWDSPDCAVRIQIDTFGSATAYFQARADFRRGPKHETMPRAQVADSIVPHRYLMFGCCRDVGSLPALRNALSSGHMASGGRCPDVEELLHL